MNAKDSGMEDLEALLVARKAAMPKEVSQAHLLSSHHRKAVLASTSSGCFYCLEIFEPAKINRWLEAEGTALRPYCGIDSVLSDNVGILISREFLAQMNHHWFGS